MPDEVADTTSIAKFLFGAPLYTAYKFGKELTEHAMFTQDLRIDGHCPYCAKESPFTRTAGRIQFLELQEVLNNKPLWEYEITCARNDHHVILFVFRFAQGVIQKIGQYPSLADIAKDESKIYRRELGKADGAEFHKAIGLAAHGVGVGSFVYLRRVFERLVARRFQEGKELEGWKDEDFVGKRMDEKIELLKDHLPDFLVKNKKIYSILSVGIHELTEEQCLGAFGVMKQSIIFILDEDKRNREEREQREQVEKAISAFSAKSATPTESD